jgi:hypothetical protein
MGVVKKRKQRMFDKIGLRQFKIYLRPKEHEWLKTNYPDAIVEIRKATNRYEWDTHMITFKEIEHAIHFEAEFVKSHERRS